MERIIAQLLLSALKDNPQGKESLVRLLQFYRDNRELIALVLNMQNAPNLGACVKQQAEEECPQQTSRPQETAGSVRILEEYLSRAI